MRASPARMKLAAAAAIADMRRHTAIQFNAKLLWRY
jgi:hypothetical protein